MMKSREEINQLVEDAEASKGQPDFEDNVKVLFESLLEYPEPVAQTMDEAKAILAEFPEDETTISDHAFPIYVMRKVLAVRRMPVNPTALGEAWDRWSDRYQAIVMAS